MAKKKEVREAPKVELTPPKVVETGPKIVIINDPKELEKLQDEGRLMGWNPLTKEAVIKEG